MVSKACGMVLVTSQLVSSGETLVYGERRGQPVWAPLKSSPVDLSPALSPSYLKHPRTHRLQPKGVGEGVGFRIWTTFFLGILILIPFLKVLQ